MKRMFESNQGTDNSTESRLLMVEQDSIILHVLSSLSVKDLAKKRLVNKKYKLLCQTSINMRPKKGFQTNWELRHAVRSYCSYGSPGDHPHKYKVQCMYGVHINSWDVSNVTDFSFVFDCQEDFNETIEDWDTSNAFSMRNMFAFADKFNQPLDSWNTSNVTNMVQMFDGATSFNQPLDSWNTSNVEGMGHMFKGATSFYQPSTLDSWNASNSW